MMFPQVSHRVRHGLKKDVRDRTDFCVDFQCAQVHDKHKCVSMIMESWEGLGGQQFSHCLSDFVLIKA